MDKTQSGSIKIRAFTASDALPIEDARVFIKGTDEVSKGISYVLFTDLDGVTDTIALPTPNIGYSLSPSPKEKPYSVYDIEISKDGYYTKVIRNVAVFSGIDAELPVNMIPYTSEQDYPRGNINAIVRENEALEM